MPSTRPVSRLDPDTTDRPFFFVHLQKTAGTALWWRLRNQFSELEMYPAGIDGSPPASTLVVDDLVRSWPSRRDQIRIVAGHFPLCTIELLDAEFVTLTVLRDPVERILSALREQRQKVPELHDTPLEEIYRDPVRHLILHNHMVKMFSLTVDEMTDGTLTRVDFTSGHLDRAKEQLANVDVVGFQEQFEDFCTELTQRFAWNLGKPVTANRTEPVAAPPALRELLAEENAFDVELYRFAREHWEA